MTALRPGAVEVADDDTCTLIVATERLMFKDNADALAWLQAFCGLVIATW